MKRALEGITVLDLGHVLAAPFCTMILADLGAEVIKIEPPAGDDSRQFGPFVKELGSETYQSGYFISVNRNKKSLCLNLKTPEGKKVLYDLAAKADVLIENYRPDTMEKLGFSYEKLSEVNPKIIYCSISGFGHDSLPEYSKKPAYDMVAQAYSGLMSITGPENGEPCRAGSSVGDIFAGHQAAIGILSALWYRQMTGEGQQVDISMVDGLVYILENAVTRYTLDNEIPAALGSSHPAITPFQAFRTKDSWIIVPLGNDTLWCTFCDATGRKDLAEDEKYISNQLRTKNRDELNSVLYPLFMSKTTEEWSRLLHEHELPFSPLNTIDRVVEDEQIRYREMVVEIDQTNVGRMLITGTPFKMSRTPGRVETAAPLLGEHSKEILEKFLHLTDEQVGALQRKGVVV